MRTESYLLTLSTSNDPEAEVSTCGAWQHLAVCECKANNGFVVFLPKNKGLSVENGINLSTSLSQFYLRL